jgi:hypothetical protein
MKRFFSKFKENKNDRLALKYIAMSAAVASFPTALVAVTILANLGSCITCKNKNPNSKIRLN